MAAWQMVKNALKKLDTFIGAVTAVCVPYFKNKHLKNGTIRQEAIFLCRKPLILY